MSVVFFFNCSEWVLCIFPFVYNEIINKQKYASTDAADADPRSVPPERKCRKEREREE